MRRRPARVRTPRSGFAGFCFPPEIMVVERWYLRYGLSYRDVEKLLSRTGHRRRSRHDLSVGTAVHSAGELTRHYPAARPSKPTRGHYELGLDADPRHQLPAAFAEFTLAV